MRIVSSSKRRTLAKPPRRLLVLAGPTASGKTSISLRIANDLDAEIISADSRQIYRFMDIGTAKPTPKERRRVKHYFIDELTPDEDFSAGEFGRRGQERFASMFFIIKGWSRIEETAWVRICKESS